MGFEAGLKIESKMRVRKIKGENKIFFSHRGHREHREFRRCFFLPRISRIFTDLIGQLCVLGRGNAPNVVCVLASCLSPQGLIALL